MTPASAFCSPSTPGTILLIAVLDAKDVEDQRLEAILLSPDMLRRVRAGHTEAAAHGYDDTRRFLDEFY